MGGTTPENIYSKLLELEKVPELQECMGLLVRAYDSIQAAQVHFTCALHSFVPILGRSLSGQGIDPETAKEAAQTVPLKLHICMKRYKGSPGCWRTKTYRLNFPLNIRNIWRCYGK